MSDRQDGQGRAGVLRLYRLATGLLRPLALRQVSRKLAAGGVSPARIAERNGQASLPRPEGDLIWFHAASVGESLSVLTLITRMAARLPQAQFLITSGTATSAALIERRMPPRCRHQFAPLDAAGPVTRFLEHWRPRAAVFVESELWPLMLTETHARGVRLALLNARLSRKSVQGWQKWPRAARQIMEVFSVLLAQNAETRDNLVSIGADPARVRVGGNLKGASDPLPVDHAALAALQAALGGRPLWVASSTHPGEEEVVLAAHQMLLRDHPDLCLLLIPRHPERGNDVAALIAAAGLTAAQRSKGGLPGPETQVWLADTLGETGTWYAACPIVFLGGSLLPIGGHNPFEPAQAGAAILTGPHVRNFAETFTPLIATGGAVETADAAALSRAVAQWLSDPQALHDARQAAQGFAEARQAALGEILETLCSELALERLDG